MILKTPLSTRTKRSSAHQAEARVRRPR
jgi:hypothetical protein